jgi:hypothetical protein
VVVGQEMDKELVGMLLDFSISVAVLYLVLEGQIPGSYGVTGVTLIMAFDMSKAVEAYKRVQNDQLYKEVQSTDD